MAIADINEAGGQATAAEIGGVFVHCDTSQSESARETIAQTVAAFGGLDILINSAAHLGGYHDVAAMPEGEWRAVLSVSLDDVFHCSKYVLPELVRRGWTIGHPPVP